jgi:hypothetical protein
MCLDILLHTRTHAHMKMKKQQQNKSLLCVRMKLFVR